MNGILTDVATATGSPNNIMRAKNYIGKSNWGDPNVDAIYDELKIFSIALNQSQIRFEMNNNMFGNSTTSSISSLRFLYF